MTDVKVIYEDLWLKNFDNDTKRYINTFCNNEYIELASNVNCKKPDDRLRLLKKIVHIGGFSNKQLVLPIIKQLCGYLISNTFAMCVKLSKDLHTKHYK